MDSEVYVYYSNGIKTFQTESRFQYDHGLTLRVCELPDVIGTVEAQFTNSKLNTTMNIPGNQNNGYFDFEIPPLIMMFSTNVHAYIYFTSAQLGETILKVEIPIIPRPCPAEFNYTPEQIQGYNQLLERMQQVIDEGVSDDQLAQAIDSYLTEHPIESGATEEQAAQIQANKDAIEELRQSGTGAPGQDGKDGQDGISPTVTVETIDEGHRVIITDANGSKSFDVMNGQAGVSGENGVSPTVTVTTITGGHRITITDVNGSKSFDVMDGKDGTNGSGGSGSSGEDGFSPIIEVTEIDGGHAVSITDVNGTTSFNVMDGKDGIDGKGVPSGGILNQVLVKSSSNDYDTEWKTQEIIITLDENGNGTISLEGK